ncbi:MAG: Stf0 family sulfotransferase [Candidatus Omnitrophota bacterium]
MTPKISYIVCSTRRSGSSLLCAGLMKLQCGVPHEYFNAPSPSRLPILARGAVDPEDYLREVLVEASSPNGICGVKIHWDDFDRLVESMKEIDAYRTASASEAMKSLFPNLSYIYVRRRDKARQAVSLEKASKTKIWALPSNAAAPLPPSLEYNYFALYQRHQKLVQDDAAWREYFRRFSIHPLEVFYEDMVADYQGTLRKVIRFLKIELPLERMVLAPPLKRLSDEINDDWYERYRRTPALVGASRAVWRRFRNNLRGFCDRAF